MRIAYTYGGIKKVTEHIVDSEEQVYYDKFSKTSAEQVIVNKVQDIRLDTVLKDLETRIAGDTGLPSQVGNSGKFLATTGSELEWRIVDALPGQNGNADKVLSTNGSTAYWATPVKLTSTVYPKVSTNKIGSYGVSEEAARADHEHPLPVYFIESYTTAVGGETELVLTEEQYPSNNKPTGFHLYRNGLLLTPEVDYTLNTVTKKITFSKACNPKENIIIVLGYLIGDTNVNGTNNLSNLIELLTTNEVPLMDGNESAIGTSNKAARADHKHPKDSTKADIDSPVFTGTPKIGNNPIATIEYVDNKTNLDLNRLLPAQSSSTAGKILASDGERAFWKKDQDSQELPTVQNDDVGKILAVDSEKNPVWTELDSELPSPASANIGSVLTLDNTKTPVWNVIPNQLPTIDATTANKVLSNNGTVIEWVNNEHISLANTLPSMDDISGYAGILNTASRADHKHPKDNTKADIDSPSFTGDPQSPTPLLSNNSNSIATTAFVNNLINREINRVNNPDNNFIEDNSENLYTLKNVNETLQDLGNLDVTINKNPTYIGISGMIFNGDSTVSIETNSDYIKMKGINYNSDSSTQIPELEDEIITTEKTIDFSKGNNVICFVNADVNFNFTINSRMNSDFRKVTLTLYHADEHVITWPENVHWDGIYAPQIETVMTTIEFITFNNGDEWYAKVWGKFN